MSKVRVWSRTTAAGRRLMGRDIACARGRKTRMLEVDGTRVCRPVIGIEVRQTVDVMPGATMCSECAGVKSRREKVGEVEESLALVGCITPCCRTGVDEAFGGRQVRANVGMICYVSTWRAAPAGGEPVEKDG